MSTRTRAYLAGLEGNQKRNEQRNQGIVSDLGILANNGFLYQGGTNDTQINNTLSEKGRAELLKRDANGKLVNERLITSILTADPVASSYTDTNTGKTKKGKISKVRFDVDSNTNVLEVDTPQGFFPKTLGLSNRTDDIVAQISDEDLLEMIDQSIIYNSSLVKGGDMLYAGGKRSGIETIGAQQDDEDGFTNTIKEVNQSMEAGQITPKDAFDIRAGLAEERKAIIETQKAKAEEDQQTASTLPPPSDALLGPAEDSNLPSQGRGSQMVPQDGSIGLEEARRITAKSTKNTFSPVGYGGAASSESFDAIISNDPRYRNYMKDPNAKNPFGLSDEEMDQLTPGERNSLKARENSLYNMNVNRVVAQEIKGLRNELRNLDDAPLTTAQQENLEQLGRAAGIDPNPRGRFLPADFINNKNLESTKDFFRNNPGEFAKFSKDPRGYLTGALDAATPDRFNLKASTGDPAIDTKVQDLAIPEIPDPETDPEGFNAHITQYAQQYQELGADPEVVKRAQDYVKKYDVTDEQSFKSAPVVDRDLNVSKALVATAIAENARLAGGSFEDSFKQNYNLFDVGTPGQDRFTAAATEASVLKNYESIRKSRIDQLFPDFGEKYKYVTDIDFFITKKDNDDNVVSSRYKDPRSDVQLTSQVRNAFATIKNNGGFAVDPKTGVVQYASQQDRSATALLHGEYFLALVNNIGSVDIPDWFDDWLGTSNAANSPAEVLQRVRINTKMVRGQPVINEIFLIKPATGDEAEESFKMPELSNFYGDQASDFRATFIQLIPKDRRGEG